ncbi:hypothetical protein HanRHA438_Chr01g0021871 [Helianthus annuus]|nr:hypothetical protein HanIR_Chr01g0023041 [Helianthus annuus]KAJ0947967.1 hypothetical protein HanRHA438_Chr01g0021871 [Helianthus annuus]
MGCTRTSGGCVRQTKRARGGVGPAGGVHSRSGGLCPADEARVRRSGTNRRGALAQRRVMSGRRVRGGVGPTGRVHSRNGGLCPADARAAEWDQQARCTRATAGYVRQTRARRSGTNRRGYLRQTRYTRATAECDRQSWCARAAADCI